MIIGEKFIFIHIPKTGGKSFNQFCETLSEEQQEKFKIQDIHKCSEMHTIRHELGERYNKEEIKNKKILTILRSPLTWYISFYKHNIWNCKRKIDDSLSWTNICRNNTFNEVFDEYFIQEGYVGFYTRQLLIYLSKYREERSLLHKIKLDNILQIYDDRVGLEIDSFLRLENIEKDLEREFNVEVDNYPLINTSPAEEISPLRGLGPYEEIHLSENQIKKIYKCDRLVFDLIENRD